MTFEQIYVKTKREIMKIEREMVKLNLKAIACLYTVFHYFMSMKYNVSENSGVSKYILLLD
jgi:hypothetical protein